MLAVTVLCGTADIDGAEPRRLAVRVYDTTPRDPAARQAALALTERILQQAGIDSDWRDCSRDAGGCNDPRRAGELVVRLVPTHVADYDQPAGSIATRRHVNDAGLSLAFAVVEPQTRVGALATVFLDRVALVADRAAVDVDALLGRAIAHEIGHLLLGTMGHSREGLMREVWTDEELSQDRPEDWRFSVTDRRSMLSGLKRIR